MQKTKFSIRIIKMVKKSKHKLFKSSLMKRINHHKNNFIFLPSFTSFFSKTSHALCESEIIIINAYKSFERNERKLQDDHLLTFTLNDRRLSNFVSHASNFSLSQLIHVYFFSYTHLVAVQSHTYIHTYINTRIWYQNVESKVDMIG